MARLNGMRNRKRAKARRRVGSASLCYRCNVDCGREAQRLATTYVWWQEAATTLANPHKLLCQILRYGRPEDYVAAEEIWGNEILRQVLIEARPGEIDPKSAHFWRLHFGLPALEPPAAA